MMMKNRITSRDYELISAYLDNQLTTKQRTQLEARLKANPTLRSEFDELNRTRIMLRALPKPRAPRNYFINSSMVVVPKTMRKEARLAPVMGMVSAISTIMLVLVLFGESLLLPDRQVALAPAPLTTEEVFTLMEKSQPMEESSPSPTDEAPLAAMGAPAMEAPQRETTIIDVPSPSPDVLKLAEPSEPTPTTIYLFAYPPTATPEYNISSLLEETATAEVICEEYLYSEDYPTSPYRHACPTSTSTLTVGLQSLLSTGSPTPTLTQTPTPTLTQTPTPTYTPIFTSTPTATPTATSTPSPEPTLTDTPLPVLQAAPPSDTEISPAEGILDAQEVQSESLPAEAPSVQPDPLQRYILLAIEVSLSAVAILSGLTALILRLRAGA